MRILRANGLRLQRIAFVPNTNLLAASGEQGNVYLWDLTNHTLQQSIKIIDLGVNMLCVAPDGTALLAGGAGKVVRWEWAWLCSTEIIKRESCPDMLALSPSGDRLAIGTCSLEIGVMCCSFPNVRQLWQRRIHGNHFHMPIVFSRDGSEVITREGKHVIFLHASTGQPSRPALTFPTEVTHIAVSPDGKTLAFCVGKRLIVWQSDQPGERRERQNQPKHFKAAAFHPNGRLLASVSNDGRVRFQDVQTWQELLGFEWSVGRLTDIAFSPNGMLAACCGDRGKIVVWDVD